MNGDRGDNRPQNLVVCEDDAYHILLERRTRALRQGGNVNCVRCTYCKQYDSPARVHVPPGRSCGYHAACINTHQRNARARSIPEDEE